MVSAVWARGFNGPFGSRVEDEKRRVVEQDDTLLTMFDDRLIIHTLIVKVFFLKNARHWHNRVRCKLYRDRFRFRLGVILNCRV